jgi:hypothetical protein
MTEPVSIHVEPKLMQTLRLLSQVKGETLDALVNRLLHIALDTEKTGEAEGLHSVAPQTTHEAELLSRPWIQEFIQNYHPDPDQLLPCGLTLRQYQNLSEEECATLWDEAFQRELDKDDEVELDVSPNALTPQQRRGQTFPGRAGQSHSRRLEQV